MRARQTILALAIVVVGAASADGGDLAALLKSLNLTAYTTGTMPPEFSARTAAGETVSLAALRGKVVIVNFWASWCLECRGEMSAFERLHHDFAARGLTVIGVNVREPAAAIHRYAKEFNVTFPLLSDIDGEINRAYGVIGLPTTIVIGRDGRAVALAVGPRVWSGVAARDIVTALLAE